MRWSLAAVFVVACHGSAPVASRPATPEPIAIAPIDAGAPAVAVMDAGAAKPKLPGPFDWPPGMTSELEADRGSFVLVVKGERISLPRAPVQGEVRDVTGDGKPDLVLFGAKPDADDLDPTTVWIVSQMRDGTPVRFEHLETMLIGAHDPASLTTEQTAMKQLGPLNVPLERVVVRLDYAKPEELREMASPKGLRLCKRYGPKKTCSSIAKSAIDSNAMRRMKELVGEWGEYDESKYNRLLAPPCLSDSDTSGQVICHANIGGPMGSMWIFDVRGSTPVLVEVGQWAEES
jgi:hypothetical protein